MCMISNIIQNTFFFKYLETLKVTGALSLGMNDKIIKPSHSFENQLDGFLLSTTILTKKTFVSV